MMVEEKILEYLDGSLGDRESAELLETLSVSPEKRALLEEHLRLKDVLALARKPYTVPVETEQLLAERLPILRMYNEEPEAPIGRFALLRSWVGARATALAVTTGALLLLAGLGWFSSQGSGMNIIPTGSNAAQSISSSSIGNRPSGPASVSSSGIGITPTSDRISSIPAHGALVSQSRIIPIAKSVIIPSTPFLSTDSKLETTDIQEVEPLIPSSMPLKAIPIGGRYAATLHEVLLQQPQDVSPLTVGGSFILNESYLPTLSSGPSHSLLAPTGDVTIDYDLSPSFSIGLNVGEGTGALATSSYIQTTSNNYTRLFQGSNISSQTLYDMLLAVHLTLLPESEYQIRFGVAGGDAFGSGPILQATTGISRTLSSNLILDLSLVGSRVWTSGTSTTYINPNISSGVIGIVGHNAFSKSLYTSTLGISAGVRVRL